MRNRGREKGGGRFGRGTTRERKDIEEERGSIRAILRLHPRLIINRIPNPLPFQPLNNLLHSIQLRHIHIRNHTHSLRPHILKVHPHLPRTPGSKPDTRSRHLKRIFFLPGGISWRRQRPFGLVDETGRVMVVAGAGVAGAVGGVGVLDGAEEV